MPFREAHGVVAALVRTALDSDRRLSELRPEELTEHSKLLDDEYYAVLELDRSLESKTSPGGTAPNRLAEQLEHARAAVAELERETGR
jgi:argininosuccinate lyase